VFTAALVHDLGKPVVDQRVQLFDDRGQSEGIWDPWQGSIREPLGSYRVGFVRERRHKLHERVVPLLVPRILPPVGLSWIAGNSDAFAAWLAALSGAIDEAGPLGEILLQADQQSVARNLIGAAAVSRVATVQAKPLAERLLIGFRYLLDHGTLPLNRPGAAGFCVGEDLWLVSKRALDALREHLLAEGQPGIPARNERLMDELQQNGLLIPNGDRAVWTAEVRLGQWCQRLTLLRFPVGRMWPDLQGRPRPAAGSVLPLTGEGRSEGTASPPGPDGPDTNFGQAGEGEDLAEVPPHGNGEGTGDSLSDAPGRGPSVETVRTEPKEPLQRKEDESYEQTFSGVLQFALTSVMTRLSGQSGLF
jgi:hypothetical protein